VGYRSFPDTVASLASTAYPHNDRAVNVPNRALADHVAQGFVMVLLYTSELFLEHQTGRGHPERPERLSHAVEYLESKQLVSRCQRGEWKPLDLAGLVGVHTRELAQKIQALAEHGGGRIEADTTVSPRSFEVAASAAGAAVAATDAVLTGPDRQALCLVRPPGHHARPDQAMGFCLFNNVALAAHRAMSHHKLDRILIVDWDVHHGNGTQDIFYTDPRVMFFSIHRYPFYPGTGAASETGSGRGLGFTRNEPVAFGTPRDEFRARFEKALAESAQKIRPQLVLISAGFDAHAEDPIGSLGLEIEDFVTLSDLVIEVAKSHCSGKIVSVLEGGYNVPILAQCIEAHLKRLLDA
jgi:acetoin utilization deacetylase AcuC-like enzyme